MNIKNFDTFKSVLTPEVEVLQKLFSKYNYKLCLSGGPVRDILMGIIPEDLDFATCATPEDMKKIFSSENIRMLNKNGEKHGTITVRMNDKINFEITTLRIDKITFGRHAEVEFTKNWSLDAQRRDLTINSMFLDLDGNLYDFCGGKSDLDTRKITFVGNPKDRIKEDFLRILRYFRFFGRIAKSENDHDPELIKIISEHASGLQQISGERLWIELKKICLTQYADSLIKLLFETGVAKYVGLPENLHPQRASELTNVCARALPLLPHPMTIFCTVFQDFQQIRHANLRLKFSNLELQIAVFILEHRDRKFLDVDSKMKYLIDILVDDADSVKCREKICEYLKYMGEKELLQKIITYSLPKFPVTGYDLLHLGYRKGPLFSRVIQDLRTKWKKSNFSLTKEELLNEFSKNISNNNPHPHPL